MEFSAEDKIWLLQLARKSLVYYFENDGFYSIDDSEVSSNLKEKRATFVTLSKDGRLRGCMGKLTPTQAIYKDVLDSVYSAAFRDPRFRSLSENELDEIKIEISILSELRDLEYLDSDALISKLEKSKPGVLIELGMHRATFLPQVWDDLGDPKKFLSRLCVKAGLSSDSWMSADLEVKVYEVVKFKED